MKPSSIFALVKLGLSSAMKVPKPIAPNKLNTSVQNTPAVAGNNSSATLTKLQTTQGSPKTPGLSTGVGKK